LCSKCSSLDGGLYVHRSGATVFAGGLYVTKNGFTVHDGGALIRSKLNNLSFALNLKLKGSLIDLQNRAVRTISQISLVSDIIFGKSVWLVFKSI